jgi:hypothetical protein
MWNLACEGVDVCRCILTNNEDYIRLTTSRKRGIFVEFLRTRFFQKSVVYSMNWMQIERVVLVGIGEFIWRPSTRTMSWHKWSWQQQLGWDQEHQRCG